MSLSTISSPYPVTALLPAFLSPTVLLPTTMPSTRPSSVPSSRKQKQASTTSRRKPAHSPSSPSTVRPGPPDLEHSQRGRSRYSANTFSYPPVRTPARASEPLQPKTRHRAQTNKHYVFVYGTLKRGFANSHFLDRATYIGEFRTVTRYPLVVGGRYNSPYLLDIPSKGARVKGEVYAIDDATLADLDHLENVGVNYSRKVAKVSNCANRAFLADAYVYFKTNALEELAKNEHTDDYQCRKYVPRHLRPKEPALVAGRR